MKKVKKAKQVFAIILTLTMLFLVGCSGKTSDKPADQAPSNVKENVENSAEEKVDNLGPLNEPVVITNPENEDWYNLPEFDTILEADGTFPVKENGEKFVLGISLPTVQEEPWQLCYNLFEEYGTAMGVEVRLQVADNDADRQIQQLQSLAAQGVDAICIGAHDASVLGPVVTEIVEMGIPVVSNTRLPVDCPVTYHVNTNNETLGNCHSEYIVNTLGITSGNIVILKGDARQITDVPQIYNGMMRDIQQYIDSGDINVVLEQNCVDWKAEEAMKHAESALTLANNDIDAFICMNDGIASGVIAVLEQKGLAGQIVVTGMDCEGSALRRVAAGTQSMTIFKDQTELVEEWINSAMAAVMNVKPNIEPNCNINNGYGNVPTISLGATTVTKDNMEKLLEGTYIDLDAVLSAQ